MTRVITAGGGGDRADSPRSPHLRFHPIPGTPDGERCRGIVDLDEPLWHNKTAFAASILFPESSADRLPTMMMAPHLTMVLSLPSELAIRSKQG